MRPQDNPFSVQRVEHILSFRPEWSGINENALLAEILGGSGPCAITGHHGAGKTTLMDFLAVRLRALGHPVASLFFNDQSRQLPDLDTLLPEDPSTTVVMIDGDAHLRWLHRRRLFARCAACRRMILARHRAGSIPRLVRLSPGLDLLHRAVNELAPDHYPALAMRLDGWFATETGNIRHVLRRCYHAVAEMPDPG